MKICEKCGMEYGDDSSFCPYCDKRYGVVILENDVISADFPAYSEEYPPIGEIRAKYKSFTSNRDEIYSRNISLAENEAIIPENDVHKLYKSVDPLVKIDPNKEIFSYAPITSTVKMPPQTVKRKLTIGHIFSILAVLAIFIFIGKSWYDGLNIPDPYINSPFPEYSEAADSNDLPSLNERPKYLLFSSPSAGKIIRIYGSDGKSFMYIMHKPDNGYWDYQFQYYNQGEDTNDFTKLFADNAEMKNFNEMLIEYPNSEATGIILIQDGVPDISTENLYLPLSEKYVQNRNYYCNVKYDDIVLGHFTSQIPIDPSSFEFTDKENVMKDKTSVFTNVSENIIITNENGLEIKLYYNNKITDNVYDYDFEFTNTSDNDIDKFCNEFIGSEHMENFYALWVIDKKSNDVSAIEYFKDGIPQQNRPYTVKPGETINGTVWIDFRDED